MSYSQFITEYSPLVEKSCMFATRVLFEEKDLSRALTAFMTDPERVDEWEDSPKEIITEALCVSARMAAACRTRLGTLPEVVKSKPEYPTAVELFGLADELRFDDLECRAQEITDNSTREECGKVFGILSVPTLPPGA